MVTGVVIYNCIFYVFLKFFFVLLNWFCLVWFGLLIECIILGFFTFVFTVLTVSWWLKWIRRIGIDRIHLSYLRLSDFSEIGNWYSHFHMLPVHILYFSWILVLFVCFLFSIGDWFLVWVGWLVSFFFDLVWYGLVFEGECCECNVLAFFYLFIWVVVGIFFYWSCSTVEYVYVIFLCFWLIHLQCSSRIIHHIRTVSLGDWF